MIRDNRHEKEGKEGAALWMTGMSGAGKTTLGLRMKEEMEKRGTRVELLDGDVVRRLFSKELGFSREDRISNLERVMYVANLLVKHGVVVICCFITPYEEVRQLARRSLDNYTEIYVKCPIDVLIERDVKGLYRKALAGEIQNFTGISDPFEEPANYEICVETDREAELESFHKIMGWLEEKGLVAGPVHADITETRQRLAS